MKGTIRNFLLVLMLGLSVSSATFAEGTTVDRNSTEYKDFVSQFYCFCGCTQNMYECNMVGCGVSDTFKKEVDQMWASGKPQAEIKQYYLNVYGEKILTTPMKQGFSLAAWITPFLVLIVGGGGVFYAVRRWVKAKRKQTNVDLQQEEADPYQDQIYDSIVEEERKKYM